MSDLPNIAYYGSHNAAIAVEHRGKIVSVIEFERLLGYKNSGVAQYKVPRHGGGDCLRFYIKEALRIVKQEHGFDLFENCYVGNTDVVIGTQLEKTHEVIPIAGNYIGCLHHESHAAGVFYQSPYQRALIVSFDGGGNDGKFNIYLCNRGESPQLLERVFNPVLHAPGCPIDFDLGFAYMSFGEILGDIRLDAISDGNLVYSGKIMGLASYGRVIPNCYNKIMDYYKSDPQGPNYQFKLKKLSDRLGIAFSMENRITGQQAWDLAASSQRVFEDCFIDVVEKYLQLYSDLPICLTGGCGLNILLNTRLVKEFGREVFVGPTPNDCGLAVGMMLNAIKPVEPADVTYLGLPILDRNMLSYYIQTTNNAWRRDLNMDELVNDLAEKKIVGVMRGNSEHGARALGNRSILCAPFGKEMKDILNEKVKHREWYRPFAPVVRLEDLETYFDWTIETRWMNFCPLVKPEWREQLGAVTHIDNTARVQTVTSEQNPFIYELLTKFKEKTGIGVLLNTSFNVDRMPILTTVKEAFEVYNHTMLDGLVIENEYIKKTL